MVKLANILALGLSFAGLATSASPIVGEGTHEISRRSTSLKCGWVRKDNVDLGCMCDLPGISLKLDFGKLPILDLSFGSKKYPPGCRPTCDDKVYECPYGSDGKGGCHQPAPCPENHCMSDGMCCPYGTYNTNGVCCPKGCAVKDGKCYIPKPKPPKPQPQCGDNASPDHRGKCKCDHGFEKVHETCVPVCDKDKKRNDAGHCECKKERFKPDEHGVCRPQCSEHKELDKKKNRCVPKPPDCTHPKELNKSKTECVCKWPLIDDKKGGCKPEPPTCHHPKELNHEETACVCKHPLIDDGKGGCKPEPPTCHHPKELNHEETACVCKHPLLDNGKGGCKPEPPTCHHPKELNHEETACVCKHSLVDNGKGGCRKECAHDERYVWGKCVKKWDSCEKHQKWCVTKCCRKDQEEKDGSCGCPRKHKEIDGVCKKVGILGLGLL